MSCYHRMENNTMKWLFLLQFHIKPHCNCGGGYINIYKHYKKMYPSISASSWLMVCLEYGCIGDSILFPPTLSSSSMKITQGALAFASSTYQMQRERERERYLGGVPMFFNSSLSLIRIGWEVIESFSYWLSWLKKFIGQQPWNSYGTYWRDSWCG